MTLVAITGTPGTGKTSLSIELQSRGYNTVDMNKHIIKFGLLGDLDPLRNTHEVDTEKLNESLEMYRSKNGLVFMDSHLSHFLDCDMIIVLRCSPTILAKRLNSRGYNKNKVYENVQSEVLDVILYEAIESKLPVYEVDCSSKSVSESADSVEQILNGNYFEFIPGRVNWFQEINKWF